MRARITYARLKSIRYVGHLDLQKVWERSLRRSQLPIAYSKGFNPQARLQIASALPLGFTSQCELLDFWLDAEIPSEVIKEKLTQSVPEGLKILQVNSIDEHTPALQTQVIANEYQVILLDWIPPEELTQRITVLLEEPQILRTWRDKPYDLRPLIETLTSSIATDKNCLDLRLSARPMATGRPEEVLSALEIEPNTALYERVRLVLSSE